MPYAPRRHRVAALACLVAMAAALLAWAVPASADEADGGRLDWGVKESFRSYMTGPIAQGEITTGDGVSTVGGVYRFHSATGEYDPDSGTASITYTGWVHFWGHDGELDVTFANPSIEYSGSSGTLYVYVNGTRTDMASLSGPAIGGQSGTVAVEGASATLTASGAQAFAGFYEAGAALDPVGFTADVIAAEPEPSSAAPEPSEAAPSEDGEVAGAILDWGVRASWRDYVSGDIAAGSWRAADGAQDGGALFRFTDGAGEAAGGDYELAFVGSVAFTGEGVDLTIADPVVTAEDGRGVLSAEVDGERIDLAEFEAELDERDGLLIAEDVPTTLSEAAVEAFSGYYQGGDEMDPLTIAVPLTADAELPALPDLGSDPETESPSPSEAEAAPAEDETSPLVWAVPAALLVLLAAAATAIAIRRRKADRTETGEAAFEKEPADQTSSTTPSEPSDEGENTKEQ